MSLHQAIVNDAEHIEKLRGWGWAPGGYAFRCTDVDHIPQPRGSKQWVEGARGCTRCKTCAERRLADYHQRASLVTVSKTKVRTPQLTRDNVIANRPGRIEKQETVNKPLTVALLIAKLHSEAEEIALDLTNPEEYGDLLETLYSLADVMGVSRMACEQARIEKEQSKGALSKGNFWTPEYFMETTNVS